MRDSLVNWYGKIPKGLLTHYQNPHYKQHGITNPFRMVIVGNSGSGKTTLVLELIHRMPDTFGHITVCCMNADEPLYKFLQSKLKPEELTVVEGYDAIPNLEDLDKDVQHLVVFDDLVLERKQDKIESYFIRGRKIAKGVSCIYLTQSYYTTPKVIRLQANYILMKKLTSTRDLVMVMKDLSLGLEKKELLDLYKHCTSTQQDFLMIDVQTEPEKRFRKNFSELLYNGSS
jgi:ABC-type dipeptide/oligopeptide/nickel transport system ATPase component